jgi:hypothetical protein
VSLTSVELHGRANRFRLVSSSATAARKCDGLEPTLGTGSRFYRKTEAARSIEAWCTSCSDGAGLTGPILLMHRERTTSETGHRKDYS